MENRSLLDMEDGMIDVPSNEITNTAGEIRKRRGRPPGSKNKTKIAQADDSLSSALENAIRGFFSIISLFAGWFGYEQAEDLTEKEIKDGAKAFGPIAAKVPWFASVAVWIGAPVWLLITIQKKFRSKREYPSTSSAVNKPETSNRDETKDSVDASGNGAAHSLVGSLEYPNVKANT
jgi:hypothetical protein